MFRSRANQSQPNALPDNHPHNIWSVGTERDANLNLAHALASLSNSKAITQPVRTLKIFSGILHNGRFNAGIPVGGSETISFLEPDITGQS